MVRGEDPRAARIGAGLAREAPLPDLLRSCGVRLVVVHRDAPGARTAEAALAGLPVWFQSADLLLVELPGSLGPAPRPRPWLAAGLGAAALAAALAGGAAVWGHRRPRRLVTSGA